MLKWTPSKINNFTSCEVFLQLAEESTRKKSSTEAMRDAGFSEEEIQNLMRAQENAVRRAKSRMKTKKLEPIDLLIQDLNINTDSYQSFIRNAVNSVKRYNTDSIEVCSNKKFK